MFCIKCGFEMNDNASFCSKCGNKIIGNKLQENSDNVKDNVIKYKLKPKFNVFYKSISNISNVAFFELIIFAIFFKEFLSKLFDEPLLAVLIVTIGVIIKTMFDKFQHDNIEYNFYNTKVEYKDGFLNKETKELKYKSIREIKMVQSVLERIFGIGTIQIYTNASNSQNGIYIHCIDNVLEQYNTIKQILDSHNIL